MKHHTSPGASGISIDMLNLLPQNGWKIIAAIFEVILETGIYPDAFKVGIITLLAKSNISHGMLSNIRPITVLESTYRLFTNMISKRVTIVFHKYNIIPPAQHACLIGRGATTPIMQMNAAMEHTIDQNRNPDIYTEMEYLPRNSDTWEVAEIMALQKNGKYTIRQKHRRTYKTTRGIAREQLRYKEKEKDHLPTTTTPLVQVWSFF